MKKVRLISSDKGSYAYVVNSVPTDAFNSFLDKIGSHKTKLKKSNSIYVYPKSLVTRDLINEVKAKYNVTQTRNPDKADKLVISSDFIKKLFKYPAAYATIGKILNRKDFLRAIDIILEDWEVRTANTYYNNRKDRILAAQLFVKSYSSIKDEFIIFDSDNYDLIDNVISGLNANVANEESKLYQSLTKETYSTYVYEPDYKTLSVLFQKRNKVFTENQFHNLINKDNCIDLETYQKIAIMLKGGYPDRELALSLISSYNWDKNLDLLGVLYLENEDAMRDTKAYASSAFRVIKQKLRDLETYSHASLIQNLYKKNLLTPIGLNEVIESHVKNLNKVYMVTQGGAFTITPDSINLTPELNEIRSKL